MKYYPALINLKGKAAIVVGGGKVAERKVRMLLKAGASVSVISPGVTPGLDKLKGRGMFRHIKRKYRRGDLSGAFIVFACTSSGETNKRVALDADCLTNIADLPSEGNFIVPSVVDRGLLTITVSTGGASPAVSREIRKELGRRYDREFSSYLRFVESLRKKALRDIKDGRKRGRFLRSLASERIFRELRKDGFAAVSKRVLTDFQNFKD